MRIVEALKSSIVLVLGIAFIGVALADPAAASRKVALVLGNSAYSGGGKLDDSANDAEAIAASLERIGFDVHAGLEKDVDGMRAAVRSFSRDLDGADIALFYYAGHAVQVDGKNYLLPVDFNFDASKALFVDGKPVNVASMLEFDTLRLDVILEQMQINAKANILFLDACRDNPFATALATGGTKTRSIGNSGQGLAAIETNAGALIGFSTSPGSVSYEGLGDHSPFAQALLTHMETPGLEINALMTRVRADVFTNTGELQRPWTNTSLIQDVYLVAPDADTPQATTQVASVAAPKQNTDVTATRSAPVASIEMIENGAVDAVFELIKSISDDAVIEQDGDNDPFVSFVVGENEYYGDFYDCNDDKSACRQLQFVTWYDFDGPLPEAKVLRWNRISRFARVFMDEENIAVLEYDYNLHDAVSTANLRKNIKNWTTALDEFERFFDW